MPACSPQGPLTDRDDQAVLLRQGDEAVGCDQSLDRIIPANQGLDTDDPSVGGELRLVMQQELLILDRPVQPSFECNPLTGSGRQCRRIELEIVAPRGLCLVHRRVGVFDQRGGVVAIVGIQADAHAGADVQMVTAKLEGLRECLHHLVRDLLDAAVVSR